MGGRSSEHDVSLASAAAVIAALDPGRFDVVPVLISPEGVWSVDDEAVAIVPGPEGAAQLVSLAGGAPPRALDVAFPVLHGPHGEDGTVQGALETAGVPYVGAGVAASAVAMDKALFKVFLRQAGIPTPEHTVVTRAEWESDPAAVRARVAERGRLSGLLQAGAPRIERRHQPRPGPGRPRAGARAGVPPRRQGPRGAGHLRPRGRGGGADGPVPLASPVGEITFEGDWYDYETKYQPGRSQVHVPAPSCRTRWPSRARALALRAFAAVDCAGLARIDFFVTDDGEVLLSELNTMPGFTPTSVYARLMEAAGIAYPDLVGPADRPRHRPGGGGAPLPLLSAAGTARRRGRRLPRRRVHRRPPRRPPSRPSTAAT